MGEVGDGLLTLFLCGDVMTGRGVDQVLPHPAPGSAAAHSAAAAPIRTLAGAWLVRKV